MAGVDFGDLYAAAEAYLEVCRQALASTPAGVPPKVFVSPGIPAHDCEMLAVHVGGPAVGDTSPLIPVLATGHRVETGIQVNLIQMTASVLRCVPTMDEDGGLPSDLDLSLASQTLHNDLWAIWNFVREAKRTERLFAPKEREFYMDPSVAQPQAGGFGGWNIVIRTEVDGYRPTLP